MPENEVELMRSQIEKRKQLESRLKQLKKNTTVLKDEDFITYKTMILFGKQLQNWAKPAEKYKSREIFDQLKKYI